MGTAFSSRRATLPSSRKRTSTFLLTRRRLNPPSPMKADTGLTVPRRASPHPPRGWSSPTKLKKLTRQKSCKTSGPTSVASSPQLPDSTSGKKSSKERQTSAAKERPDYHESEDSCTSRHKERSCHEKSGKPEPDKESSSAISKWGQSPSPGIYSAGCKPKEPHTEVPSNTPKSSHTCPRSPSICLSELEDCPSFSTLASTSALISHGDQPCYRSASTDSRLSVTPMDLSVCSSLNFYGQPGIGRGGATPSMMSPAGSQQGV